MVINLPSGPSTFERALIRRIENLETLVPQLKEQLSLFQTQCKMDFNQYAVKPNAGGQEKFSFSFPVKHAWIEVIDNMDFVKNTQVVNIADKTVEFAWSTTPGPGRKVSHVDFRLWAAGF